MITQILRGQLPELAGVGDVGANSTWDEYEEIEKTDGTRVTYKEWIEEEPLEVESRIHTQSERVSARYEELVGMLNEARSRIFKPFKARAPSNDVKEYHACLPASLRNLVYRLREEPFQLTASTTANNINKAIVELDTCLSGMRLEVARWTNALERHGMGLEIGENSIFWLSFLHGAYNLEAEIEEMPELISKARMALAELMEWEDEIEDLKNGRGREACFSPPGYRNVSVYQTPADHMAVADHDSMGATEGQ
ncbi:Hypothetical predicted protein [Lecanosticta acicola]|uniref:Uncharacterized protein n=1 Tax=Lecanosticta acicola TaxID=111012 RepID=A0AAI8Z9K5_9PEZI|nr:Hypothetical predicted protein [Lecanosticta acicola]